MTPSCRLVVILVFVDIIVPLRVATVVGSSSTSPSNGDVSYNDVRNYTGHTLIRTTPLNDSHVTVLTSLDSSNEDKGERNFSIQLWKQPRVKRSVDLVVSREDVNSVSAMLREAGLPYDVITDDLQSVINEQVRQVRATSDAGRSRKISQGDFSLNSYHTYDEIIQWLDRICMTNNLTCQSLVIGKSFENRDLKVIQIGGDDVSKPAIWIDAGIHAREWIAPATTLHLINKLLDSSDRNSRYLVSKFRWFIYPMANPDGYAFTWTNDRLWRKTRSKHPRIKCIGTDFNRNWNYHWAGSGTSNRSCSEDYIGPTPFSEPETRAMSEFMLSIRGSTGNSADNGLIAYISLHSYGQHWLTPWGYTQRHPADYMELVSMATPAADAIRRTSGRRYTIGQASRLLYVASGASDDWAKGVAGIKYSYTIELRDAGKYGFLLPETAIEPTGNEIFQGIRTLALGLLRERRQTAQRRKRKHRS